MARYTGPKNRLSRRAGLDLFGRGHKLRRATVPPGQHGAKPHRRPSDYGVQLHEKQKVRRIYGIMEKQFHKYYEIAARNRGSTGETLLKLLETRLDNVVFRLGFAPTRAMARQLVGHGHITINNQIVTIPSYQVKTGEVITLATRLASSPAVAARLEDAATTPPTWLKRQATVGEVIGTPARADLEQEIDEQLIVEYYSR